MSVLAAAAKGRRRSELYGPDRCLARDAAKQKLVEDHVKQNFQKGAEIVHSSHTFQTTTSGHFGPKDYQKYHRVKPKTKSCVHFGSDFEPSHSSTKSDYAGVSTSEFQPHVPKNLGTNNLVDFAPKYRVEDLTGHSQYTNDFDGEKTLALKRASKASDREESSNQQFHISTHFVLGDDKENPASETSLSFRGEPDSPGGEMMVKKGASKTKSSLFQEGDYNMTTKNVEGCFISTQNRDFVGLQAAGVSTVTRTPHSHVTPKDPPECAVSALRKLLIAKNEEEFKNPRDPITLNVVKAFATYDQQKSGSISVQDLRAMCKKFNVPIDDNQIQSLLRECNCEEEGKIDFVKFCEYLTCHREPPKADFTSTNQATYPSRAQNLLDCEESEDDGYRTRTSFVLGYDEKDPDTVYMKDFNANRLGAANKPPFASGVPCSKVMHEYPVFGASMTSVSNQDYVKHVLSPGRLQDLKKSAERHSTVSVELRCGPAGDENLLSSETALTFTAPKQSDHPKLRKPTLQTYNHLESNNALPHPLILDISTEVQHNYKTPLGSEEEYAAKKKESLDDRNTRIQENKSTHYVAGYDPPLNETEHMSQFFAKKPVEPDVKPAGCPDLPSKGYSLTTHDSGETYVATGTRDPQQVLQQRNYLKNINPRDTVNLNLRKAFLEYDKNLSGAISKDDIKAVCNEMKVEVTEADLDDIIARCDLKGDGLIDYHEFALNLTRLQPPSVALLQPDMLTSTTQADFKPPKEQRMDPKQQLMQEKDAKRFEPVEIQPSRLFQWAPQTGNLETIKMSDFKEPESILATL